MSKAFHPQTDAETEHIHMGLEAYLQSYWTNEQNDCAEMLAMAKFTYNNLKHSVTKITPF